MATWHSATGKSTASLAAVLAGFVAAACGLAWAGEEQPAAGEKVALGRDLRAFPQGDYEAVQSFDSRTQQQAKDQAPQTTSLRHTFTFDMKFKPPGEQLGDEGEITVTVRRIQVEMEVGARLIYDSAGKPDLKVEPRPEPREGAEPPEAKLPKKEAGSALALGQAMARQLRYLVGRSSSAAVRVSLLPNRPQVEAFEGLDEAWNQFAKEDPENPKEPGKKLGEAGLMMLKRNYGDAMLNRMLAQGVEFLPPPGDKPRDPAAPLGQVRKASVAAGDAWKVSRRLLGAFYHPVSVDHTCTLIAVKEGGALIRVAWTLDHKEREAGKEEKAAAVSRVDETGTMELTFHAASAMLVGLKSTVTRVETTEGQDEGGRPLDITSKTVETRLFALRPKI